MDIAYSLIYLYCFLRQKKLIPWDVQKIGFKSENKKVFKSIKLGFRQCNLETSLLVFLSPTL